MLLNMYTAPGQGQATPWGQNLTLMSTESPYHFAHLFQVFKQSLWSLILYTFFHVFPHVYIAPDRDRQHTGDKVLMTTERPFLFAHMLQVSKWSLRNLILYTFLMILFMYIAPGQGQKTPWGQTFDANRKPLSLRPFVASFKQVSLNSDFIHIFSSLEPKAHKVSL